MGKSVVIVSTLDTKWEETKYLRMQLEKKGYNTIIMDLGMKGKAAILPDITREEIITAAGEEPSQAEKLLERSELTQLMIKGGGKKAKELFSAGKLDGIIGLGGATGTLIGTSIMKVLPFGVPKYMVSSMAGARGLVSRYFGTADIVIMHSVVDFTGLNDLIRDVLDQAAGAISGMIDSRGERSTAQAKGKKEIAMIAMTMLGTCEKCATYIRNHLEEEGYQVVGFSASGVGDRAMEELIEREGMFSAVIDLAPGGVGEELLGGTRAAGQTRLEAAGNAGIPQIIAPCAVNLMSPPKSKYKPDYYTRKKYDLDSLRTFLRVAPDEMVIVAKAIADKLNKAKGPVKLLIPLEGWSSIDNKTTTLYEPEMDRVFVEELRKQLKNEIEIREIKANIEDLEFAEAVVRAFHELVS